LRLRVNVDVSDLGISEHQEELLRHEHHEMKIIILSKQCWQTRTMIHFLTFSALISSCFSNSLTVSLFACNGFAEDA
jgi:hypothetical protein